MTTLDPRCGAAVITGEHPGPVLVTCPCGWSENNHPSRSSAKQAQRAHRFPPLHDDGVYTRALIDASAGTLKPMFLAPAYAPAYPELDPDD